MRVRHVSLYTELARTVRDSGLLRRRYAYYWSRITVAVAAFFLLWVGIFLLGNSWFQLVLAAAMGVLLTQFGFLGHDAAHRQIFASARWNEWAGRVFASGFAGLSYNWWISKHNRHHAAPNQEGRDPDIASGALAFTRNAAEVRHGLGAWLLDRQGWFFFPLLTLEALNLHVQSVKALFRPRSTRAERLESGVVILRLAIYVALLLYVLPFGKASAFFGLQMGLFGLCLGGSFAPNHKGMPIVPPTMKIDFLQRQVLMSRNVRGGVLVDFAMGEYSLSVSLASWIRK